ncbi:MAG: D-alanine--D-alanine ligase [Bacteroidales bacterium]|nr:D-alanine--D-alanine ligase [Bacteroidales bacterium]
MKKNIAILAGGDSSEYEISIKSAKQVIKQINGEKFTPFLVNVKGSDWHVEISNNAKEKINKDNFSFVFYGKTIEFDFAFIVIHGTPGENGILQSYFDLLRIPYSTCSSFVSALTFNKYATKLFLKEYNIPMAKHFFIRKGEPIDVKKIVMQTGLPCFVKPNNGGSSFGVSKVKELDELVPAIEKAFEEDFEVIIEEFIKSTELTCGVMKTKKNQYVLPITEIVSKNEFFDYEAKYLGASEEITPARISPEVEIKCKELTSNIYDFLGCKGVVRIDFLLRDNQLYFMEINTVPGMSEASIIPQQVAAEGLYLMDFFTELIEDCMQ